MVRLTAGFIFLCGFAMFVSSLAIIIFGRSPGLASIFVGLVFGSFGYCNMHLIKASSRLIREFHSSLHWKKENRAYFRERKPDEENPQRFRFLKFGGTVLFIQAFLLFLYVVLFIFILIEGNTHNLNTRQLVFILFALVLPMLFSMIYYGIWLFRAIRFLKRYIVR